MKILIIRHGDPDYVLDSLTEKGKREAALLADRMKGEKIDVIYTSPLGRARLTARYTANVIGKEPIIKDWLQEFSHRVDLPYLDKPHLIWDLLPEFWSKDDRLYDREKWREVDFMKKGDIAAYYREVCDGFDALLAEHGYVREGRIYRAERPNRETIALFCHFGVESVLLSHILSVAPTVLGHGLVALPTSVTTIYTEERRKGVASLRVAAFGDLSHLFAGGEEPSFSARFCETFDSDERHD